MDCYGNGSKCVAIENQCDGIADCPNGKDESVELCGKPHEGINCLSFMYLYVKVVFVNHTFLLCYLKLIKIALI